MADGDSEAEERREAASRGKIAEAYREQRTRELKAAARAAVGNPVEVAARFGVVPSGTMAVSIPFVGMVLSALRSLGAPKPLRGLRMLALSQEELYAIGSSRRGVLTSWPREAMKVTAIASAGTDSAVTFEGPGEPARFQLYCSSLQTNPWAADLVRALGGEPPAPIDPTKLAYDATDLPTV